MKPTYVEFDALRNELSVMRLQLALAREALEKYRGQVNQYGEHSAADDLAAIDDAKLLDGYVLCDGEPVGEINEQGWPCIDVQRLTAGTPLYARRKP